MHPDTSKILAHRGYWLASAEQNSVGAALRAVENGFGLELDVRQTRNELVCSHDHTESADSNHRFSTILDALEEVNSNVHLAIDVKEDGLLPAFLALAVRERFPNAFFVDMSVPEHVRYVASGAPVALRVSEVEPLQPNRSVLTPRYLWIDQFFHNWLDSERALDYVRNGYLPFLVSPSLHSRSPGNQIIGLSDLLQSGQMGLCVDIHRNGFPWGSE